IERMVAAGATFGIEFFQAFGQPGERVVVVEGTLHEPDSLRQPFPYRLPERGAGVLLDGLVDHPAEILVLPVAAGKADQCECGWQQPAVGQVVDRWHYLPAGQIAGDAED